METRNILDNLSGDDFYILKHKNKHPFNLHLPGEEIKLYLASTRTKALNWAVIHDDKSGLHKSSLHDAHTDEIRRTEQKTHTHTHVE